VGNLLLVSISHISESKLVKK